MKKLEVFEVWVWRRLIRVPWTSRGTNKWVLAKYKQITTEHHQNWAIDLLWAYKQSRQQLEKLIMQGKLKGKEIGEDLQQSGLTTARQSQREMFTN